VPLLALKILMFVAIVAVVNLPFGSYRNTTRKFSVAWFASIHLPIPFIIILRMVIFPDMLWIIPFSIGSAIAGQIIGKRFNWFDRGGIEVETV